jgi:thiamine-phosphate pyrophosphorylase
LRPHLSLSEQARLLVQAEVQVAQVRCKRLQGRAAWEAVREAVAVLRAGGVVALVNDRVDWALLAGADGVHVGDEDLPAAEARVVLGPDRLVGVTVRNAAGAHAAAAAGASYVGLGPLFPTRTKAVPAPVLGLERLRREVADSPLPVIAIGGIGLESMADVARAGAHGAAVLSDLWAAGDVPERAKLLQARFLLGETASRHQR